MSIESVSSSNYIKKPSKVEANVIRTMNRFFDNDPESIKGSREEIIVEVQRRTKPLVTNMVKRIAWLEGGKIFEKQMRPILEEEVDKITKTVMDTVLSLRKDIIRHIEHTHDITEPTNEVEIPLRHKIKLNEDVVQVFVNGMVQSLNKNYTIITEDNFANKISFSEGDLDSGDVVEIKIWKYSE